MDKQQILEKVAAVFKEVFIDDTPITLQTAFGEIESWDSIGHYTFLAQVEAAFGIKFQMTEITEFTTIGKIVDGVDRLINK